MTLHRVTAMACGRELPTGGRSPANADDWCGDGGGAGGCGGCDGGRGGGESGGGGVGAWRWLPGAKLFKLKESVDWRRRAGTGRDRKAHLGRLVGVVLIIVGLQQVPGARSMPTPPSSRVHSIFETYGRDQQPPASVFGNRVQALVASLPQRLGIVDRAQADGENCTDCSDGMSLSSRETFEKLKLEQLRMEILHQLNIDRPPNATGRNPTFNKPVSRFLNREREELWMKHQQRLGSSNFAKISEIVSYGEEAANFSDNAVVMFRLSNPAERSRSLQVMSASLYMLLRYRKHTSGRTHRESTKRRRRVKVNIYPVYPDQNARRLDADTNKTMFGSLEVMVRHTRWQKLILPVSEIQKVVDSSSKALHLRITCDNCGKDIEPVLAARRTHGRRRVRTGGKKKMNKRRPLLIVHTAVGGEGEVAEEGEDEGDGKEEDRLHRRKRLAPAEDEYNPYERSRLAQCAPERPVSDEKLRERCGKRKLWISFKDMGWDDWILFPKGYYVNYCEGTCPYSTFGVADLHRKGLGGVGKGGRAGRYQHRAASHSHYAHVMGEYSKLSPRHRKHRLQAGGATCCRPRKMSALHLIYFDESGNIVKTLLRDMVVDRCGCA